MSEKQTSYRNEAWKAYIFNYLTGCERDIERLTERLKFCGYEPTDMTRVHRKDWDSFLKDNVSRTRLVFFYGYGYGEQIYLGVDSSVTESISFEVFYLEMKKFQEKEDALILFSNTCFKAKDSQVKEDIDLRQPVSEVFHFCTKVIGECKNGSLMTKYLLDMKSEQITIDFEELARNLSGKINSENNKEDKYCVSTIYYGITGSIKFPALTGRIL